MEIMMSLETSDVILFDYFERCSDLNKRNQYAIRALKTFEITLLRLMLSRIGQPGVFSTKIFYADSYGNSTDSLIAHGVSGSDLITVDPAGEWYDICLERSVTLKAGAKYVIVIDAPLADADNMLDWIDMNPANKYLEFV